MFCKWCGATIPEYETVCPRCGKEQPPLAECGGFFHLVPGAKRNATASLPQEHRTAEPASEQRREVPREGNAARNRKKKRSNLPGIIATCLALAALLVAIISSAKTERKLKQMENDLRHIAAEQETVPQKMTESALTTEKKETAETTTEQHTEAPTEATEPYPQLLGKVIEAEYHFDNRRATVTADKEANNELQAVLDEEDGEYHVTIKYRNEDWIEIEIALEDGQISGENPVLHVEYELKSVNVEGRLVYFKDPKVVSAKWRLSVVDPWTQLDGSIENAYSGPQNMQLFEIPIEWLNIDGCEFEFEITMGNNQGGCCKVQIDGIRFNNND